MALFKATSPCGEADIKVEIGDNFDHLDAKIQKALNIPHAVSAYFDDMGQIQGAERTKPVLSMFPAGTRITVVCQAPENYLNAEQNVGEDRDELEISKNNVTAGADQRNEMIRIGFSPRAVRVAITGNTAQGKAARQVNLISRW